jgi:hypothetical protein
MSIEYHVPGAVVQRRGHPHVDVLADGHEVEDQPLPVRRGRVDEHLGDLAEQLVLLDRGQRHAVRSSVFVHRCEESSWRP